MEILAGHNRVKAAKTAGLAVVPAIILENISDEEAWFYVVETNLMQRSFTDMSHSEKAAVIAAQHSKLFSQRKRNDILRELVDLEKSHEINDHKSLPQSGERLRTDRQVAAMYSLSKNTVARYLRVMAVAEYINTHPKMLSSCQNLKIVVTVNYTKERIRLMVNDIIEEKLKGITFTAQRNSNSKEFDPVSDDEINMMIDNLDVFGV